jgi:allantoin racemase
VAVVNVADGPATLDSTEDLMRSELAVYRETLATNPVAYDAVLIDCVFEPALVALKSESPVPVFGPIGLVLPIVSLVARTFSFVIRSECHRQLLENLASEHGTADRLASTRSMELSYGATREPALLEQALGRTVRQVVEEDGADAVVLGSTTWAVPEWLPAAVGERPIFMPGMSSLGLLELIWGQGLFPRPVQPLHMESTGGA